MRFSDLLLFTICAKKYIFVSTRSLTLLSALQRPENHCPGLVKSMRIYGLDYRHGMIRMFFRPDANPPRTTRHSMFEELGGQ